MNTRFVFPAVTALSFHTLVFFGLRPPTRAPQPPEPPASVLRRIETILQLPDEPTEATDQVKSAPAGEPDARRSEEPPTAPRSVAFEVPAIPRTAVSNPVDRIPLGPVAEPGGGGDIGIPGNVIPSSYLDNPPRTRAQIAPAYPFEARKDGQRGEVLVEFTVDESGQVMHPRVVRSSSALFEEATVRAVAKWRFEPGRKNGRPVRFKMAVPVQFSLNE